MAVIGILGSPRRGGNSELLLSAFLKGVSQRGVETELIRLNTLDIHTCQACENCAKNGKCVINDDMQGLYPKIANCQGLVLATPIYFGTISAQLKTFIERFQCWWLVNLQLSQKKRPAFLLCTAALKKEEFFENAERVARIFCRCLNLQYRGTLFFAGYDQKGSIKKDPANLKKAWQSGYNFLLEL